jgi:hypothetical protein
MVANLACARAGHRPARRVVLRLHVQPRDRTTELNKQPFSRVAHTAKTRGASGIRQRDDLAVGHESHADRHRTILAERPAKTVWTCRAVALPDLPQIWRTDLPALSALLCR